MTTVSINQTNKERIKKLTGIDFFNSETFNDLLERLLDQKIDLVFNAHFEFITSKIKERIEENEKRIKLLVDKEVEANAKNILLKKFLEENSDVARLTLLCSRMKSKEITEEEKKEVFRSIDFIREKLGVRVGVMHLYEVLL